VGLRGETILPDGELVAAVRAGSAEAVNRLVDRYYDAVLRYLTRRLADPETAADLTQNTFFDAFRHLDRLDPARPFAPWLYRIARNHLLMERRRQRLHRVVSLEWLPLTPAALPPPEADLDDPVQRALDALTAPLSEALLLHSVWGFSVEEIAVQVRISPAAARKRLQRAKDQFRIQYAKERGGSVDERPL